MDQAEQARPSWWRRRNWWKIGFFLLLFVFELTREVAVVGMYPGPKIAVGDTVASYQNFVSAEGRWVRLGEGDPMAPGVVKIECRRDQGTCEEVNVGFYDGYVTVPTIDVHPAIFTADQVSYQDASPACVTTSTRIDLNLKKVFAVREGKPNDLAVCKPLLQRLEMTLGSGYQPDPKHYSEHFLPLTWLLSRLG